MTDPSERQPDQPDDRDRRRRQQLSDQFSDLSPEVPRRFQVCTSVYCRRCSYDLRSLDVEGRCPECGLDIWPSVMHMVDPTASKLPRLRDPHGVGNGLVWLLVCALLASIALTLSAILRETMPPAGTMFFMLHLPVDLTLVSGVIALAGLWSVWKFMPPRGNAPDMAVRRDAWLLAITLLIWAAVCFGLWQRERVWMQMGLLPGTDDVVAVRSLSHLAIAVAAIFALHSIRRLLDEIGARSREYRRARHGRQGIRPMMVGAFGAAVGSMLRYLSTFDAMPDELRGATIIVMVSMLMLLIGLVYLLVNAWWIRRVLLAPRPRLRDLLRPLPLRPDELPEKSR